MEEIKNVMWMASLVIGFVWLAIGNVQDANIYFAASLIILALSEQSEVFGRKN